MDASMGGRTGPSPPPWKKINVFFPYRLPSYSCGDLFANFLLPFSMSMGGGGPFWACPPLPTKISAGAMQWCNGKFLLWNAIMALWSHILSL